MMTLACQGQEANGEKVHWPAVLSIMVFLFKQPYTWGKRYLCLVSAVECSRKGVACMRCPFCFAQIGENLEVCPRCHETLAKPDGTIQTVEEVWGSQEDYHVWILLGNLLTIIVGGLLFYWGIKGLGILGIGIGLVLLGMAALSLLITRGGSRWNNLTRGQRTVVWAGVTGVIGLLAVAFALINVAGMVEETPAQRNRDLRHLRRNFPGPLPKMPSAPGDESEAH
jgi:hypothetical protein